MQAFNPYLTPAQQNSQIQALQQQIGYLQSQLQSAQAAQQQYQQQISQMPQISPQATTQNQPNGVITRIVENFENITANDVPMDNNGALFAKMDGSELQLRRWSADGRIMITPYKPVIDENNGSNENTVNSSNIQQKMEIGLSDEVTGAFMQRFDEISNRLDLIEKAWNGKQTTKNIGRTKKEENVE